MTPFYERDGITIYCCEAGKLMGRYFEDATIDLTVTSPPYDSFDKDLDPIPGGGLRTYNGYSWDFKRIAKELYRVTKKGGVCVWVVGDATVDGSETGASFRQALGFMGLGFNLHDTMIYEVAGTGAKGSNLAYWQGFEFMLVASKGQPKTVNRIADVKNIRAGATCTKGRIAADGQEKDSKRRVVPAYSVRTNIWRYQAGNNGDDQTDHDAPFPEALARDHIISWSNEGDLVFDCFLGSGTTAKMAQQLGRRFVGCEISEEYCKVAVERLRQPSFFSLPTMQAKKPEGEQIPLNLS